MTVPYRKKLIEVALPLKAINEASVRENYIYRGNPSGIHKWWAQRPLAACRAVLFASLVDDPDSDPAYQKTDGTVDEERAGFKRAQLFNVIEELVQWENSNNPRVINAARAEIARCVALRKIELGELAKDKVIFGEKKRQKHPKGTDTGEGTTAWEIVMMKAQPDVVDAFLATYATPVLDPFSGGGSIPLEAQRLGLRAYASDLNPVPVLITKALIEIPPKFAGRPPVNPDWQDKSKEEKAATVWQGAQGLAEDVRYYGQWMRDEAEKRIGNFYPKIKVTAEVAKERPDLKEYVGQELTVIAWLWARTVPSPNPVCGGAHVPLMRSFWLSTKQGKETWLEPIIDRDKMTYRLEVRAGKGEPPAGTMSKKGDKCLLSGVPILREYIRGVGKAGQIGVRMLAVVAKGTRGRLYLKPPSEHELLASGIVAPEDVGEAMIVGDTRYLTPITYGMNKYRDLFTSRQLQAQATFCNLVSEAQAKILSDSKGDGSYADAVVTYLAFALDKTTEYNCSLIPWYAREDRPHHLFSRQALPMVWDFAELNPLTDIGGSFHKSVIIVADVLDNLPAGVHAGIVSQESATDLQTNDPVLFSTDPPYYDNVPYADLSDFFYVWLRQMLHKTYPDLFATLLVPKKQELVADRVRHGGRDEAHAFFEQGMRNSFARMVRSTNQDVPTTIYYAFKQAEEDDSESTEDSPTPIARISTGWETFLQGLVDTGWQVNGTWPLRTERTGRIRDNASNALASSIVLVCRPRSTDAHVTTRKEFMNALRQELPEALRNLQHGNIAPVDLAQAAIGPGMAVFTRYAKVIESDGSPMIVRTALGIINQVLDEVLAEQEGEFDADTRWALAWFEQFGMKEEAYGVAETLSKAKNTAINGLVEAGIVKAKSGKVQLVNRAELPVDWNPATDKRLTVWETTQHLIRTLETKGEGEAAALLNKLGGLGETARDLAYRLYSICERKKWADEALAYNSLVIAWPELTKLALSSRNRQPSTQHELFS